MLTLEAEPDHDARPFLNIDFSGGAVVAISGGSDSTALLILLKDHFRARWPAAKLVAVTIDHALRAASHDEALQVGRLCAGLGIEHRIRVWDGPKPRSGIAAAGREARYRLLATVAREEGVGMVVSGHTADDQAETVAMRLERSEDARGLAGMAPATLYDDEVWIVRPLLRLRRAQLRDMLRQRGVGWIDDPTNEDRAYERPRVRAALDGEGFATAMRLAAEAARKRCDLGARAAHLIRRHAAQPVSGLVHLQPAFVGEPDREAAAYALRLLLAAVGGLPQLADTERAEALLAALAEGTSSRATLARVLVDARRGAIFLLREARGLPEPMPAVDGFLWDGRRRITLRDSAGSVVIAAAGGTEALPATGALPRQVPESLARAALAAEPAVWRDGRCLGRQGAGVTIVPVVAPFARFLPGFDLEPARALAQLAGAAPIPYPPLEPSSPCAPRR